MKAPSKENNWFKKNEKLMLEQATQQRERRMLEAASRHDQEELDKLRVAHWMKCPKCGHDMETVILKGIDVENCTFCQGVYFDRTEIESLLLRRTTQRFSFYRKFFGLD